MAGDKAAVPPSGAKQNAAKKQKSMGVTPFAGSNTVIPNAGRGDCAYIAIAQALCERPGGAPFYGDNVSSSACTFADEVVLASDLPCDGDECDIWAEAYVGQLTVGSATRNVTNNKAIGLAE